MKRNLIEILAKNIKRRREYQMMTQTEVATRLGIRLRQFQRIESYPNVNMEMLMKIARVLQTDPVELLLDRNHDKRIAAIDKCILGLEDLKDVIYYD